MTVVDDYLLNVPEPHKSILEHVRKIILEIIPDAEQVISYGMPSFKVNGKYIVHFAAFKDHLSLFPGGLVDELKDKLKDELKDFKLSKGTIQFTPEHQIPDDVIHKIVQFSLDRQK